MTEDAARTIPSPEGRLPLIGHTLSFHPHPLDFCLRAKQRYGDLVRFGVGIDEWYLVSDPAHVHRVLVSEASKFHKPKIAKRLWKPFLGEGLLGSDGEFWKRHHKMIRPGFHRRRIEAYGESMVRLTDEMLHRWRQGERRDICDDMTDLTLAIVAKTLFDADVTGEARRVGKAMEVINKVLVDHINRPIDVPRWWPSKTNKRKVFALDEFRGVVKNIIDERRRSGEDRGDLLSMLVHARDDSGQGMTDQEVHDEAVTLFFAGHETTAIALTHMWYLLAKHPTVQSRVREEIRTVVGKRAMTISDLPNLPYLDMVVKESMRILPSVWCFMREPTEDFPIGDQIVPKGGYVLISPYILQHDHRFFDKPEEFRPERFSEENEKKIPKGAYVPFSSGPRVCLGKNFAMMEAKLILGTLVQRCAMTIPADYELSLVPGLSLRAWHGLPSTVELLDEPSGPFAAEVSSPAA